MSFLFINTEELNALMELPLIQRVAYFMGIRPYRIRKRVLLELSVKSVINPCVKYYM
jgi:hypothetical protein